MEFLSFVNDFFIYPLCYNGMRGWYHFFYKIICIFQMYYVEKKLLLKKINRRSGGEGVTNALFVYIALHSVLEAWLEGDRSRPASDFVD